MNAKNINKLKICSRVYNGGRFRKSNKMASFQFIKGFDPHR